MVLSHHEVISKGLRTASRYRLWHCRSVSGFRHQFTFVAARFILGLFAGGYVPGAMSVLALFYKGDELAIRTSVLYFGNYFATATGSLIAAGILQLAGRCGLAGWQWLFIIEGTLTVFSAIVFFALLPESANLTRPIHGFFDFFTESDREILRGRVEYVDSKRTKKAHIDVSLFVDAISDSRIWLHAILNIISLSPRGGLQLYSPSIIKSLGFGKTRANLLDSVSSYLVVILSFVISYTSDKTGLRGPLCVVAFTWSIAFAGALLGIGVDSDKWIRYAVFTLLGGGNALAQALNNAWLSINARSPHKRSIGLALVVTGSNIGGIIGPQLFRASDAPRYVHGFLAILVLYAASVFQTLVIMWVYWRDGSKMARGAIKEVDTDDAYTKAVEVRKPQI